MAVVSVAVAVCVVATVVAIVERAEVSAVVWAVAVVLTLDSAVASDTVVSAEEATVPSVICEVMSVAVVMLACVVAAVVAEREVAWLSSL